MNNKTHFTALAFAGLLAQTSSFAQSVVTLYGSVDASLNYTTNKNAAGTSLTALNSGSFLPSNWGITGAEDLSDGAKAFFKLENSFNVDTGAQATPVAFFNRFAYVGLSNNWGTVSAGRLGGVQYDYTVLGTYDPTYGTTYGIGSLNAVPIQLYKLNNAIKYVSPSFAGISGTVMYSFGQELPGNSSAGRYKGAGLEYVNNKFRTRVTYETSNGTVAATNLSSLSDKRLSVAARYDTGPFELFADYVKVSGNLNISPAGDVYIGSIGYKFSPALRVVAHAGQYNFDLGDKTRLAGVLGTYSLSKRTLVYTSAARVLNGKNSNFGVAFATVMSSPGQGQTGVALGIRHAF
ncbi:porin [Polaromonas glacialis]|uniref:porin n=1 Tax=Polaromonas glacialis TaxID=866564 RepID=UPI0009FD92A5|nr:porin [Polaromonas glacialis]